MSFSERENVRKMNDIYEMLITYRDRIETLENYIDEFDGEIESKIENVIKRLEKTKRRGKLEVLKITV